MELAVTEREYTLLADVSDCAGAESVDLPVTRDETWGVIGTLLPSLANLPVLPDQEKQIRQLELRYYGYVSGKPGNALDAALLIYGLKFLLSVGPRVVEDLDDDEW